MPRRPARALYRALDPARDQSYFLYATTPEQLDFLRFPLGELPKDETRRLARELGLSVAEKPDSQDICFVPQGRYADVIARLRPGRGAARRRSSISTAACSAATTASSTTRSASAAACGLAVGEPLYVVRLEPDAARVVVGPRAALATSRIRLRDVNWLGDGAARRHCRRCRSPCACARPASRARRRLSYDRGDGPCRRRPGDAGGRRLARPGLRPLRRRRARVRACSAAAPSGGSTRCRRGQPAPLEPMPHFSEHEIAMLSEPQAGPSTALMRKAYARWAPVYDVVYDKLTEPAARDAVEAAVACGPRILEAGVGTGLSLGYYPAGSFVCGVDLSEDMLQARPTQGPAPRPDPCARPAGDGRLPARLCR